MNATKEIECPLCHRMVPLTGDRMAAHVHTPMLGEWCEGGGRTFTAALEHARESLRKYRAKLAAKHTT